MHKFYWRNTHGPGARRGDTGDSVQHYRLGKSGSADNILSEVRPGADNLRPIFRQPQSTFYVVCLLLG